jgi:hypothetical protein
MQEDDTPEVLTLNDAVLLGKSTPEMEALLDTEVTLMGGRLYGMKDRRNTQDGDWKPVTMTWWDWIAGVEGKFGLSRHPVAKSKEGDSLVFAASIGGARKDSAIKTMASIGLDIDSGAALDEVLDKLEELELFAIVYTSFSHGKDVMELKHDDVVRKLKLKDSPNRTQVQEYLRNHHKDRYDADFINEIEVIDARKQTQDGLRIVLKTKPLDKFRVIIPLAKPVELSDLAPTVSQWKDVWADAVCGVAVNMLGVNFDATSCDVNRLFFTPRHPKDAEDWYCCIVQGEPLSFDKIEPYSKNSYVKNRDDNDPFAAGTETGPGEAEIEIFHAPSGKHLNKWHSAYKERFLITDVIETYCDDKIRKAGGEKVGTVHCECPFEHEHSTTGGTATMCMNPLENENGYWTMFCRHDACQGRNKLEFIKEMLEQGWFEEDVLEDDQFCLPAEDDVPADEIPTEEETAEDPVTALVSKFDENAEDAAIVKFLKKRLKIGDSATKQRDITVALAGATKLPKPTIMGFWRQAKTELRSGGDDDEGVGSDPIVDEWDFKEKVQYAVTRIQDVNRKKPFMFQYMESVARIEENSDSIPRITILNKDQFMTEVNEVTNWIKVKTKGDAIVEQKVSMPADIGLHLYGGRTSAYPKLRGLIKTPVFTADGDLITVKGYHPESGLYYQPDNMLDVPKVSKVPTAEEIYEAKRLLVEDVLGDFPLGGLKRDEIVHQVMMGEGVPAVTHIIGMLLLMFCREMIKGPTPGHLLTKPSPATGASLLTDICSIIANGEVTPAMSIPPSDEEMQKTLVTAMSDGSNIIYFDNIDKDVNSGTLASTMTAPIVKGRMLGHSKMLEAEVRCVWVLCGNNVRLSHELIRRLVMVDLDARMADPESRSGWRHDDIGGWVRENRGRLVWACLTLIQHWIAQGQPKQTEAMLNSYENWSRVIGGILKSCELHGFLDNRAELKERAADSSGDDITLFLETWWERHIDKPVLMRSLDEKEDPSLIRMAIEEDLQLPLRLKRTVDDDATYDQKQFDGFLMKYHMQVFRLSDGTQVSIKKGDKVKKGQYWQLEVLDAE